MPEHRSAPTSGASPSELATVGHALHAFGLWVDELELRQIAKGWELTRASIDALYEVPDVRYADPALRFRAEPGAATPAS